MSDWFESKDFIVRVYSGLDDGGGGKFYIVGVGIADLSIPGGASRPGEQTILDRGIANTNMGRVAEDDTVIFDPVPISVSFRFNASLTQLISAFGNPDTNTPWTIGAETWTPVTTIGQRANGRGVMTDCPLPADTVRRNGLIDLWAQYGAPPSGGSDHFRFALGFSVNPNEFQIIQEPPSIRVNMNGMIYGGMGNSTAFPAGTESVLA